MLSGPPTGHFLARRGLVKKQYFCLGRTAGGSRQYTHATSPDGLDSPIRPPANRRIFKPSAFFSVTRQTPRINSPSTASALLSLFESDQFPSHILCRQTHVGQIIFHDAHKKISAGAKNTRAYSTMVARSQRAHHIALSRAKCDSIGAFCRPGPRPRKNAAEGGPTVEHTFENNEEALRLAASFSC